MKRILLILLLVCIVNFSPGCSSLFFYPQKQFVENYLLDQISYKDVNFKTSDGLMLHGWYLKAKNESHGTILFLHGNAENISTHVNNILWLTSEGYNVFAFDYRGYGRSEGFPSIDGVHLDAEAALETVLRMSQINKGDLFILGQSLGGAIATYTTATSPYKSHIKALIIDSAFSDYRRIAREKLAQMIITWPLQYPLSFLFNNHYSPAKWIKKVSPVPLLIIHGDIDNIVPPHHGLILFQEALEPKEYWLVNNVGHIQALALPDIRSRLVDYLQRH